MRIGEIRNIIKRVINDDYEIQIKSTSVYGGQAYQISDYPNLVEALNILSKQSWNTEEYEPVEQIILRHRLIRTVILTADEYSQLNAYVTAINSEVPLFYLTLDDLTEGQDEKTINIKLPDNIRSFDDLNEINKRLADTLKLFNIDGPFEFRGFDRGSEWYVVVTAGFVSYQAVLAGLKIAQEVFKTRTEYFKSEEARISYELACKKAETKDKDAELEEYKKEWIEKYIEKKVEEQIENLGLNGHTKQELQVKLVKATTKLVQELGTGTEFHLSLNPPTYAEEEGGELKIDYQKIKELTPKEEKTKQLTSQKVTQSTEESNN